jgi:hypothetical protein
MRFIRFSFEGLILCGRPVGGAPETYRQRRGSEKIVTHLFCTLQPWSNDDHQFSGPFPTPRKQIHQH